MDAPSVMTVSFVEVIVLLYLVEGEVTDTGGN